MKVVIVLTAFLVAGALAMPEMGEQFVKECLDQEKVDVAEHERLRAGTLTNPSENIKCYSRCLAEKGGFLNNGMFVDEKVKEFYSSSPMKDALLVAYEKCNKIEGSNECDTAFQVCGCMRKSMPA